MAKRGAPRSVSTRAGEPRAADSSERAYAAIRTRLVEFQLKPEERINEQQLALALRLSRTPVRAALNRLASEGFCSLIPNRGFYVRRIDTQELLHLFEARAELETSAFRLACRRATDAGISDLAAFWQKALHRYELRHCDEILELDEAFHLRLTRLSGNPELERLLVALNARIRFVRCIQIERGPQHDGIVRFHAQIVEALRRRAAGRGCTLLRQHIALTVENVQVVLKEALFRVYSPSVSQLSAHQRQVPLAGE